MKHSKTYTIVADATVRIRAMSEKDALSRAQFRLSGTWELSNHTVADVEE